MKRFISFLSTLVMLTCIESYYFQIKPEQKGIITKLYVKSEANIPLNQRVHLQRHLFNTLTKFTALNVLLSASTLSKVSADGSNEVQSNFIIDKTNNFAINIPSSFLVMKTKPPTPSISKYTVEDTLFTASNFNDSSSLSITKTDVRQLLKDFNIDWWFAPLNSISEVGSPELIAKLLVLQRQYDFENKKSVSEIVRSSFSSLTETTPTTTATSAVSESENNDLYFIFKTPVGNNDSSGRIRYTFSKAYFKDNYMYVVWVSSSKSDISEQNIHQYDSIIDSFHVI